MLKHIKLINYQYNDYKHAEFLTLSIKTFGSNRRLRIKSKYSFSSTSSPKHLQDTVFTFVQVQINWKKNK